MLAVQKTPPTLQSCGGETLEDFDEIAAIFSQVAGPRAGESEKFVVGYALGRALKATGELASVNELIRLLRAMEALPQWDCLVNGTPDDMLGCDLLFVRT